MSTESAAHDMHHRFEPARATSTGRVEELVRAALATAGDPTITSGERAELLMELAMSLQVRPKTPDHLPAAIRLYEEALLACPTDDLLLRTRVTARQATALQALPGGGVEELERARKSFEEAIPVLGQLGSPEELAEAEMNLGLVLQCLAPAGRARIADAVAAYQRALRVFDAKRYPLEFVLLQNNLATAFLSMPFDGERGKLREALAVQCFEEGLKAVTLVDHPVEYAMLQNNLGNALQYAASRHFVENSLRALEAYDEALKVRTRRTMPAEYANTIANKANCLRNMPDDPGRPEAGNAANLAWARSLYDEAHQVFVELGEMEKAHAVAEAIAEMDAEANGLTAAPSGAPV